MANCHHGKTFFWGGGEFLGNLFRLRIEFSIENRILELRIGFGAVGGGGRGKAGFISKVEIFS